MQSGKFQEVLEKVSRAVNAPLKKFRTRGRTPFAAQQNMEEDCGSEAGSDSEDELFTELRPRQNILRRCDSACIMRTNNQLRREFPDMDISPRLIFDNPSIEGITQKLCGEMSVCSPNESNDDCQDTHQGNIEAAWPLFSIDLKMQPFTQLVLSETNCAQSLTISGEDFDDAYEIAQLGRYFRRRDGMECILIPSAVATIGTASVDCSEIEGPCHQVELSSFLMDIEPVSVGAYARFLNATQPCGEVLLDWCLLLQRDERSCHLPLYFDDQTGLWHARPGVPLSWPMILVSWYGANAYSLWVHGHDWHDYKNAELSFLPTEAQWEYAARGVDPVRFPWGDAPASPELLNVCWDVTAHDPTSHTSMPVTELPLIPVNEEIGMSPFGLRGMAGNIWQWCRDTYDPHFYRSQEASFANAWNQAKEEPKVEKGGSWVGPADLARSSYRRGRLASAKGRCLGFRCIGSASQIQSCDEDSTRASTDDSD